MGAAAELEQKAVAKLARFLILVVAYIGQVLGSVPGSRQLVGWRRRRCPRRHARTARLTPSSILVCSLNSSLNLLNKWSLGVYGFRFPLLLTSCGCSGKQGMRGRRRVHA